MDETLWCDCPIETAPKVLSRDNNYLVCRSNFLVCVNEALWHDHLNETFLAEVYLNSSIFKRVF